MNSSPIPLFHLKTRRLLFIEQITNTTKIFDRMSFIYFYQLQYWQDFILEKTNNLEWNQSLVICLQIFQGSSKFFYGLPTNDDERKNLMRPFLSDLILRYIQEIAQLEKESTMERWQNKIITGLEFLIKIEDLQFLFTTFRSLIKRYDKYALFLSSLEQFILKNQIKSMPNDALKDVMQYLKGNRKLKTLKQLIINLDITQLDSGYVIQLCVEFNLLIPLLYICPRVDEDYITPIVKMFAIHQNLKTYNEQQVQTIQNGRTFDEINADNLLEQYQSNHILKFIQDQQYELPQTQEEIKKLQIDQQGFRCYWYIKMCFEGELFPNERIPIDKWGKVLLNLIVIQIQFIQKIWLLAEETFQRFIALNPLILFEIIKLLFQQEQMQAISKIENESVLALKPFLRAKLSISLFNPVHDVILNLIAQQIGENYQDEFALFISELLAIPHLYVQEEHALSGILYLISNHQQSLEAENLKFSYHFLHNKEWTQVVDVEQKLEEKERIIMNYIMKCTNKEFILQLQGLVEESPMQSSLLLFARVEVRAHLEYVKKNYLKVIDVLLSSSKIFQRRRVFYYINLMMNSTNKLVRYMIEKIKELVFTIILIERFKSMQKRPLTSQNSLMRMISRMLFQG